MNVTLIGDGPRFPHRGVMLDVARHFLPLNTIKNTIRQVSKASVMLLAWLNFPQLPGAMEPDYLITRLCHLLGVMLLPIL